MFKNPLLSAGRMRFPKNKKYKINGPIFNFKKGKILDQFLTLQHIYMSLSLSRVPAASTMRASYLTPFGLHTDLLSDPYAKTYPHTPLAWKMQCLVARKWGEGSVHNFSLELWPRLQRAVLHVRSASVFTSMPGYFFLMPLRVALKPNAAGFLATESYHVNLPQQMHLLLWWSLYSCDPLPPSGT